MLGCLFENTIEKKKQVRTNYESRFKIKEILKDAIEKNINLTKKTCWRMNSAKTNSKEKKTGLAHLSLFFTFC
jgi:hypothetical protein